MSSSNENNSAPQAYEVYTPEEALVEDISAAKFQKINHISTDMKSELQNNEPSLTTDILDKLTNHRCPNKCQNAMARVFPIGRVFSSISQSNQMATTLGASWGFTVAREGFSFRYILFFICPYYN